MSFTVPFYTIEVNVNYNMLQGGSPRFWELSKCGVFAIITYLLGEGHYWQTQVLLSLKSCEYSDVCSGASRHQPDILLKLLN